MLCCVAVAAHAYYAASLSDLPSYDFIRESRVDMTLQSTPCNLQNKRFCPKWPLAFFFLRVHGWCWLIACLVSLHVWGIFLSYLGANEPKTAQQLRSTNMHEISIQKQHDIATLGANLTCGECCYFTAHFILKKGEGAKQQSRWENSDGIQITPLAPSLYSVPAHPPLNASHRVL